MKKAIIIVSALLLVLVLLVIIFDSLVSFSPAIISVREKRQLTSDFFRFRAGYNNYFWYYAGARSHNCRCYGRDNGYILFFYSDHHLKMDYENTLVIDGVEFCNPDPFSLYAYKDGKFIDIVKAYEQGLISRDALLKAQQYHNQCLQKREAYHVIW